MRNISLKIPDWQIWNKAKKNFNRESKKENQKKPLMKNMWSLNKKKAASAYDPDKLNLSHLVPA